MARFRPRFLILAAALLAAGAAGAQLVGPLPLPGTAGPLRDVQERVGRVTGAIDPARLAPRDLLALRADRLRDLVRAFPDRLEMTALGPALRGELVALDPDAGTLAAARAAGFAVLGEERIEALDLVVVRLAVPRGLSVDRALQRLERIAPGGSFAPNHLHLPAGAAPSGAAGPRLAGSAIPAGARPIGLIDGGVAAHPALAGPIEQRGFVAGAPRPADHGTAVASLAAGTGAPRGAAPGAPLLVADIYGADPGGGNALALARALGWMAERRVPVVAVSLVGPANPLVARAVAQSRARGVAIVAAVGNDGPAAPPAFPASYPGVIAVTGVDARGRPLPEAGRAARLDYAAPGADMAAAHASGRLAAVRGTSYAVPLVAGRLHQTGSIAALDREAAGGGGRGLGRGIVCGACRTPPPARAR
jgi:minor extracellular protease Epr